METAHSFCSHFLDQLNRAKAEGFVLDIQLFPCGTLRCISTNQVFTSTDFHPEVETCVECRTSFYRIKIPGGLMGTAIEFWDY